MVTTIDTMMSKTGLAVGIMKNSDAMNISENFKPPLAIVTLPLGQKYEAAYIINYFREQRLHEIR